LTTKRLLLNDFQARLSCGDELAAAWKLLIFAQDRTRSITLPVQRGLILKR